MMRPIYTKKGIAVVALSTALSMSGATMALSENVTLTGKDGSTSIIGDLISFDNGVYVVQTAIGEMQVSASLADCAGPGCPVAAYSDNSIDTRISGSASVGAILLPTLMSGYAGQFAGTVTMGESENPDEEIFHLIPGDSGARIGSYQVSATDAFSGFLELSEKIADIAISSRRILRDEAKFLRDDGAGNMVSPGQEHIIATENLVVVVHPSNTINAISMADVQRIYNGEIISWKQFGIPLSDVSVHAAPEESSSNTQFGSVILKNRQSPSTDKWIIGITEKDIAQAVANDVSAIGYVGSASSEGLKVLDIISSCGITYPSNSFSAKTEDTPFTRRIYAYNRSDVSSVESAGFVDYVTSGRSDSAVDGTGFESLAVERVRLEAREETLEASLQSVTDLAESNQMREMLGAMAGWDRLSSTIRFVGNSDRLDNKAELDIIRLIDYLEAQTAGTRVSVVGFTDSDGPLDVHTAVSIKRAEQVLRLVRDRSRGRLSHIDFSVQGYGEISPVSCNGTPIGDLLNRRVEFWIR